MASPFDHPSLTKGATSNYIEKPKGGEQKKDREKDREKDVWGSEINRLLIMEPTTNHIADMADIEIYGNGENRGEQVDQWSD